MSRLTYKSESGMTWFVDEKDRRLEPCEMSPHHNRLAIEKLAQYEDLEEQLEKIYGGKLQLEKVVENLNRIVQNGEEKLDFARILTNEDAEKWDRWKDLEEAGKLIELPCKVGDTVWIVGEPRECVIEEIRITPNGIFVEYAQYDKSPELTELWDEGSFCIEDIGKTVFLTKAEAEAKLAELKGGK